MIIQIFITLTIVHMILTTYFHQLSENYFTCIPSRT